MFFKIKDHKKICLKERKTISLKNGQFWGTVYWYLNNDSQTKKL